MAMRRKEFIISLLELHEAFPLEELSRGLKLGATWVLVTAQLLETE